MYLSYSRSKLANMMMIYELAKRFEETNANVTANVLEPGVIQTKLLAVGGYSGSSVAMGARAPIYLASSQEVEGVNGKYFNNNCDVVPSASMSYNAADQKVLWDMSEEIVGLPKLVV